MRHGVSIAVKRGFLTLFSAPLPPISGGQPHGGLSRRRFAAPGIRRRDRREVLAGVDPRWRRRRDRQTTADVAHRGDRALHRWRTAIPDRLALDIPSRRLGHPARGGYRVVVSPARNRVESGRRLRLRHRRRVGSGHAAGHVIAHRDERAAIAQRAPTRPRRDPGNPPGRASAASSPVAVRGNAMRKAPVPPVPPSEHDPRKRDRRRHVPTRRYGISTARSPCFAGTSRTCGVPRPRLSSRSSRIDGGR